jgi:hypothetical protein
VSKAALNHSFLPTFFEDYASELDLAFEVLPVEAVFKFSTLVADWTTPNLHKKA